VTVAEPLAEPEWAVIVAVPFATAVTRPLELTVATASSADDQVTGSCGIGWPFWSST
jgi:hypothetical protein